MGKSARTLSTSKLDPNSRTLVSVTFLGNFATVLIRLPPNFPHAVALAHCRPQRLVSACHSWQQTGDRVSGVRHNPGQNTIAYAPGTLQQKPSTATCEQSLHH